MKYICEPRRKKKFLFFDDGVVYDVFKLSQRWRDESYGNGGGEYHPHRELIKTHDTMIEAINHRNNLNKMEGGNNARN